MSQLISLRDRKRTETWVALHAAAAELTLAQGPENVPVEEIAARANVSQRTFFNYFSTKEDAILGLQEPSVAEEQLDGFSVDHDLLEQTSRLLIAVVHSTEGGDPSASLRIDVVSKYPQLRQRRFSYFLRVEQLVKDIVAQRIADSPQWQAAASRNSPDEIARMIVLVAGAPMRYAMQESVNEPTIDRQLVALEGATALLREVLEQIR